MAHKCNDTGNVERLLRLFGDQVRYVPKWGRFMVWNGQHWTPDERGVRVLHMTAAVEKEIREHSTNTDNEELREQLEGWAHQSGSVNRRKAMVELLRCRPEIEAQPEDFDAKPYLFNCENGTLDLRTGKLRHHQSSDYLTVMAPVEYDPEAKSPKWDAFLERMLPVPEVRAFMQRYLGYALSGFTGERLLVVCIGVGRNGKSTINGILERLMGDYARVAESELLLARGETQHPTGLADLFGRRLVLTSEVRKGCTWDEERVKRLTGGDSIRCRRLYEDYWVFRPSFKLLIAANDRPRVLDAGDSFWDRIAVVPFPVQLDPTQIDTSLPDKLMAEAAGILNWLVAGCLEWQRAGLQVPQQVKQASNDYRDAEDRIGAFISECFVFDGSAYVTSVEIAQACRQWCENQNLKPFSEKSVIDRLLSFPGTSRHRTNKSRGVAGIRVKSIQDRKAESKLIGDN